MTKGYFYIATGVKMPGPVEGYLLHRMAASPDGTRCLSVGLSRHRPCALCAVVLAHELHGCGGAA